MSAINLVHVLDHALAHRTLVPGLVVLGWEDALAYVEAAEELNTPAILQAGPGCRAHTPVPVIGPMMRYLADQASVPVVVHLDHGYSYDECAEALDYGFTSVMYDGSKLPIEENIATTRKIAALAHRSDISVEGEVGFVGYNAGAQSAATELSEIKAYSEESQADAVACSIGNVHLQTDTKSDLDFELLKQIESVTSQPLVIHGGSGVSNPDRIRLAKESRVCKINIGTELRQEFGASVRDLLAKDTRVFDRLDILKPTIPDLKEATKKVLMPFVVSNQP